MTSEQKKQLIEKFTDIAVDITHIPKAAFSVIIHEHDDENYGVGGVTLDKVRKQ
jgi:4-oxalocrotonate tautomerase